MIVLVAIYGVARFFVVFTDSRLTGDRAPYIQKLTTNSVVIRWLTEQEQLGVVRYSEDQTHFTKIELDSDTTNNHKVLLSNLKPATRYYYQVGNTASFQQFDPDKHWFQTHPEENVPTRVWVMGDSGDAGETLNQVRDQALSWMQNNPILLPELESTDEQSVVASEPSPLINIWLALGDIAYRSGTNEQYQAALFEPFSEVLPNVNLWPVYGNHDDRRWTYFRIFDLPEKGEAGGLASKTENYYAIDYSNIHFVVLDSQSSDRDEDGKMADWLKQDLAQNRKPWVVVAFHHPPYSKGSHDSDDSSDSRGRMHDMRENILPILEKSGVDVILSGHSHMYERSYLIDCVYGDSEDFSADNVVSTGVNNKHQQYIKPLINKGNQGTIYMVAGSSSKVDTGNLDHPVHHVGLREAGSVVIDVVENKLIARFINDKGQIRDSFSIEKKTGHKSDYQGCK